MHPLLLLEPVSLIYSTTIGTKGKHPHRCRTLGVRHSQTSCIRPAQTLLLPSVIPDCFIHPRIPSCTPAFPHSLFIPRAQRSCIRPPKTFLHPFIHTRALHSSCHSVMQSRTPSFHIYSRITSFILRRFGLANVMRTQQTSWCHFIMRQNKHSGVIISQNRYSGATLTFCICCCARTNVPAFTPRQPGPKKIISVAVGHLVFVTHRDLVFVQPRYSRTPSFIPECFIHPVIPSSTLAFHHSPFTPTFLPSLLDT